MSLKFQVAHGLKWQAVNIVGQRLLSLCIVTTLARLLDTSAFGLVALSGVYLFFTTMLADQGITIALIQRQNLTERHLAAAFWFNLTCNIILCLATIALAGYVAHLFREPRLAALLRVSSFGMVLDASSAIHGTLFVKAMDFRRPAIRAMIGNIVGGAVGVSMAFAGLGVWALIGQQLCASLAGAIFYWSVSSYRPWVRFSFSDLRDLFGISISVFATSVLWFISSRLDQIVIGRFAGADALGFYALGGKLPDLANTITQQPVSQVTLPALSKVQNDHGRLCQIIYRGMKLNALFSFAIFVGLACISWDIVPLLFGAKWAGASGLCALLSLYALVNALHIFFYPSLLASGGVGKYLLLNVWHTAGVLIACVVGIQFGVKYLVIGLITNNLIVTVPALIYLRSRIGLNPISFCRPCIVPALASLLMAAVIWAVGTLMPANLPLAAKLTLKVAIGAVVYTGFMYTFQKSTLTEIVNILRQVLLKKRAQPAAVEAVTMIQ